MSRLLAFLVAVNLLFFTSTLLLQWRWRLPEDEPGAGFVASADGGWAAAVRRGSRLWGVAQQARTDYSAWSAVAAEAAGAANEGVGTDSDAIMHLRNIFQQGANLTALQQAQHERLRGSAQRGDGGEQQQEQQQQQQQQLSAALRGGQLQRTEGHDQLQHSADGGGAGQDGQPRQDGWSSGSGSGQQELVLADFIPGDGSGYAMPDPAIVLFCYNR